MTENGREESETTDLQDAVFGGGCFWCIEAVFTELRGVDTVEMGYAGGGVVNPTYQQVCAGDTGHAEVVRIRFDPDVIAYRDLLTIFFHVHNPTTLNEQGPDKGPQYRSIILTLDEEQRKTAEEVKAELEAEGIWEGAFVTEIVPFEAFFRAEDYHQAYYRNNPDKVYCKTVISPKVLKLRKLFGDRIREEG